MLVSNENPWLCYSCEREEHWLCDGDRWGCECLHCYANAAVQAMFGWIE